MRRLNVKLLAILGICAAVFVVGVVVLHHVQMRRTAKNLLDEGQRLQDAGDLREASKFYYHYINYEPKDVNRHLDMALLLHDIAVDEKLERTQEEQARDWYQARSALDITYTKALTASGDGGDAEEAVDSDKLVDVQRKLIETNVTLGRFGEAIELLEPMLAAHPKDAELHRFRANSLEGQGHFREAADAYTAAIEAGGIDSKWHLRRAMLLRTKLDRPDEADAAIEAMVAANPNDHMAYLFRAQYLQAFKSDAKKDTPEAAAQKEAWQADVRRALEIAPKDEQAILSAAEMLASNEDYAGARELLDSSLKENSGNVAFATALARTALLQGDADAAASYITNALKQHPRNVGLIEMQTELFASMGDTVGARNALKELPKLEGVSKERMDFLAARIDVAESKWSDAAKKLERVRPYLNRYQQSAADRLLVQCYQNLRQQDKVIAVIERNPGLAAQGGDSPLTAAAPTILALTTGGKNEEALLRLRALRDEVGVDAFVDHALLRGLLINLISQQVMRSPEAERDWSEVEALAAAWEAKEPESPEVTVLRVNLLNRQGRRDEARQRLEAAIKASPANEGLLMAKVAFVDSVDGPDAARQAMSEVAAALGDTANVRMMKIQLAARMEGDAAKAELAALSQGLEAFNETERDALLRSLGGAYFRVADLTKAAEMWQRAADAKPTDPAARNALFELAVQSGDDARMQATLKSLREVVGEDSAEAKLAEARLVVHGVRTKSEPQKEGLAKARALLRDAAAARPGWASVPRAQAEVELLDGNSDEAIEFLQQTMKLGQRDTAVVQQLVEQLHLRGRSEEARTLMTEAKGPADAPSGLDTLLIEADIAFRDGDAAKAVELATRAVEQDPKNARKLLALARFCQEGGDFASAEKYYRAAIDIDATQPLQRLSLVQFLMVAGRKDDAKAEVEKLKEVEGLQQVVLAGAYDIIEEKDEAERLYRAASDEKPDDLGLIRGLAMFYLRHKEADKALAEVDRVGKAAPKSDADRVHIDWAARVKAAEMAKSGEFAAMQGAVESLSGESLETRIAKANLLASRPEVSSRLQAIELLEAIDREQTLTPENRYRLAILHNSVGRWDKCRDELLSALRASKTVNPEHVAFLVRAATDNDDLGLADTYLNRLRELAPEAPSTIALAGVVAAKKGDKNKAAELLSSLAPENAAVGQMQQVAQIGALLEQLEIYDAAEDVYRRFARRFPDRPLVLASYLARHGDPQEALRICETAAGPDVKPEAVIQVSLETLRNQGDKLSDAEKQQIEKRVVDALAANPKSTTLRLQMSELRDIQGRTADVERIYKEVLADASVKGRERALVLNNLAFLLAAQEKPGGADKYVAEAIDIMGPTSDLLDTRAVVYLGQDRAADAIRDLTVAMIDNPTGVKLFHLAQAQHAAGDTQAARRALERAVDEFDLEAKDIGPYERAKFDALRRDLGVE